VDKGDLRCEGCGNYLDPEELFCSNCGRETPGGEAGKRSEVELGFIGFRCETCGATLTYDAEEEGLRCSFCGSVTLKRDSSPTGRIRPEWYVPFEVPREKALRSFEGWISRGFFRPFGFKEKARVVSMRAVYIPFWTFRAKTRTYYAGDSSQTPAFARADWCPVFGERDGEVTDVLVCASGSLHPDEVSAIAPFDFSRRRPYRREEVRSCPVEDFGLSRRGGRPRARALMLKRERSLSAEAIPGSSRNVHVNTLFFDLRSEPVLLPVRLNAYRFQEETYRFLVNGQTGELVGRAPFSYAKLGLVVLLVLAIALAITAIASRS
jgi:DNA-directed RNA polymerase subunit RPC12/RpoP